MIIDTSVLLAIFFKETHHAWAQEILDRPGQDLHMSTVNLTELLIRLKDKQEAIFNELREKVYCFPIQFIAPDIQQAELAAEARLKYPLNLGDCFVYALAKVENSPIITLDSDFKKTDLTIIFPE